MRLHEPQCAAMFSSGKRRIAITVFCMKRLGHGGDHRGHGKQWNSKGKAVPITEKLPP